MGDHVVSGLIQLNDGVSMSLNFGFERLVFLDLCLKIRIFPMLSKSSRDAQLSYLQISRIAIALFLRRLQLLQYPQLQFVRISLEILVLAGFFQPISLVMSQLLEL